MGVGISTSPLVADLSAVFSAFRCAIVPAPACSSLRATECHSPRAFSQFLYSEIVVSHPSRKNYKRQVLRLAALAQDDNGEDGAPRPYTNRENALNGFNRFGLFGVSWNW